MSEFVTFFFDLSNNTKLYHWTTTSYARHKAVDKLFDNIIEFSDKFMETYMGRYGRPKFAASKPSLALKQYTDKSIVEYYKACIKYLETEFAKPLTPKDTDLLNIRDEILGELNKTLYLMTLM